MAEAANLLRHESSPYLLQHADNPVHWRPWGAAALAEARAAKQADPALDRLRRLPLVPRHGARIVRGPETAALMNSLFVNIKVDREERPDIDHLYMSALHATGRAGRLAAHDVPRARRHAVLGRHLLPAGAALGPPLVPPGAAGVCRAPDAADDDMVTQNTAALRQALARAGRRGRATCRGRRDWTRSPHALLRLTDPEQGGLRGAPKFPNPPIFRFLWQDSFRTGTARGPRRAAPDAGTHVAGRHLRPSRRRLRALLDRCGLAGAAFREDALRQRATPGIAGAGARRPARPALRRRAPPRRSAG